ncbi:MAG: hypothetical protein JWP20_1515 [Roseomonas sp.]|nr:hypothetical protein [Roseomonas sp.]
MSAATALRLKDAMLRAACHGAFIQCTAKLTPSRRRGFGRAELVFRRVAA